MKFEFTDYNKTITDLDLIADLKNVAKQLNIHSLSMAEYDKCGKYNSSTVRRRFHTWNNALSIANLNPKNQFYPEEEMLDNLYTVWMKKGRQPTRREMDDKRISSITSNVYCRKYGTWKKALLHFIEYVNDGPKTDTDAEKSSVQKQKRVSRDVSLRLRFKVMERDHFKCVLCGASPATNPSINLHIDHILPYSKGGETTIDNLQTLCSKCNLGKGDSVLQRQD